MPPSIIIGPFCRTLTWSWFIPTCRDPESGGKSLKWKSKPLRGNLHVELSNRKPTLPTFLRPTMYCLVCFDRDILLTEMSHHPSFHVRAPFNKTELDEVPSPTPSPVVPTGAWGGNPVTIPGLIEAEEYDFGGEGVAYSDADPGNNGGVRSKRSLRSRMGAGSSAWVKARSVGGVVRRIKSRNRDCGIFKRGEIASAWLHFISIG